MQSNQLAVQQWKKLPKIADYMSYAVYLGQK